MNFSEFFSNIYVKIAIILLVFLIVLGVFYYNYKKHSITSSTPGSTPGSTPSSTSGQGTTSTTASGSRQGTTSTTASGSGQGTTLTTASPNIPDDIYIEWYSDNQYGISVTFYRNNTIYITNCINNIFGCPYNTMSTTGSIVGHTGNIVTVNWQRYAYGINSFTYVNSTKLIDSIGNIYRPRWGR